MQLEGGETYKEWSLPKAAGDPLYGLPNLPVIVADDLMEDRESPLAPTLQILLSKMWDEVKGPAPRFSVDLYQDLKQKGILLEDFLDEQMAEVHKKHPSAVASGLALDILSRHTTPLGTSRACDTEELIASYAHKKEVLPALLQTFRDLYLLVGLSSTKGKPGSSRLAHDTLAPLIRARFKDFDFPGQRASRVLDNRIVDWRDGNTGIPLDKTDLEILEQGMAGMHVLDADEQRLLEASLEQRAQRQRLRKWLRVAAMSGVALIVCLSVFSLFFAIQANKARGIAKEEVEKALAADSIAQMNSLESMAIAITTLASVSANNAYERVSVAESDIY